MVCTVIFMSNLKPPTTVEVTSDLEIILSLLGTGSVNPKPTDKRGENMFKIGPKMTKICPKVLRIRQYWPKNIPKVRKLMQKSYSRQKVRDFPSKSYCWSPNLLGTPCPGAATISSFTWLDLSWLHLSWMDLSWLRQSWFDPLLLDLSWPDLTWPDLTWLGLTWLDLSWLQTPFTVSPETLRTFFRHRKDTLQKPSKPPLDTL